MSQNRAWEETADGYRLGAAEAKRFEKPEVFVILTFGVEATVDTAFDCIVAAMPFGQIAIHGDEANRVLARELHRLGWIRFAPFVGLPFDAFGIAAIKQR